MDALEEQRRETWEAMEKLAVTEAALEVALAEPPTAAAAEVLLASLHSPAGRDLYVASLGCTWSSSTPVLQQHLAQRTDSL